MGSPVTETTNGRYTFADYLRWPDDERWEIIDGEAWCMTPAPTPGHQELSLRLGARLLDFFSHKRCKVYAAVDVVFDAYNVVQPDICVVCDPSKITAHNIQGAPDLVVEILSPSSSAKDKREKKSLYERAGVTEYIILHPTDENIERFRLKDGSYQSPEVFNWNETFLSFKFPDLTLNLWEIFDKELPAKDKARPRPGESR